MSRALILIDIQEGMDSPLWGARNNPDAEHNAARLLSRFRDAGAPLFHVYHLSTRATSPLHPDNGGTKIKAIVAPRDGEPVYSKQTNSAFIGTALERDLRKAGVTGVVIAGLSTPQCISTSVRMAANLGFDTWLAHDACAAFETHADNSWSDGAPKMTSDDIHRAEVSMLHGEFCRADSTDAILEALT
ncbi:cysteine hydrolase family protein [Shimia thalassica]|uniref:cysteine hydrolase family protein n=1 Tax=Shimia thalassica TaxID=1715693 RepID=UPI0026E3A05A|nr:cysteine hydrolase family protein [Shimia thalassica]MDO6481836.1 cysteine hydrolase family protein [Shimia thalassica]